MDVESDGFEVLESMILSFLLMVAAGWSISCNRVSRDEDWHEWYVILSALVVCDWEMVEERCSRSRSCKGIMEHDTVLLDLETITDDRCSMFVVRRREHELEMR